MNLDQFVTQTLLDITKGVLEAQAALTTTGMGRVNPDSVRHTAAGTTFDAPCYEIDFDVSVLASSDSKAGGGFAIQVFRAGAEIGNTQGHSSRIRFRVPLELPLQRQQSDDRTENERRDEALKALRDRS